eukprot:250647-Alexandrium_andersonii.AAC.1
MSDVSETVHLEDMFDDIDAEMDYLIGLLESAPSEGQSGRCLLASSDLEEAPDFIRALFAAGATLGEVRALVAEVFSPPRATAMAERRPRL